MERVVGQKIRFVEFTFSTWFSFSFERELSHSRPVQDNSLFATFDSNNKLLMPIIVEKPKHLNFDSPNDNWLALQPFTTSYFARTKRAISILENKYTDCEISFLILDTFFLAASEKDKKLFQSFLDQIMHHTTNIYRFYSIPKAMFEDFWKKADVDKSIQSYQGILNEQKIDSLDNKKKDYIKRFIKYKK